MRSSRIAELLELPAETGSNGALMRRSFERGTLRCASTTNSGRAVGFEYLEYSAFAAQWSNATFRLRLAIGRERVELRAMLETGDGYV